MDSFSFFLRDLGNIGIFLCLQVSICSLYFFIILYLDLCLSSLKISTTVLLEVANYTVLSNP